MFPSNSTLWLVIWVQNEFVIVVLYIWSSLTSIVFDSSSGIGHLKLVARATAAGAGGIEREIDHVTPTTA